MKGKIFSVSLTIVLTLLVLTLFTPLSFAQSTSNITGGPVSQYKFKAAASWMRGKINLSYYNDGSADKFAILYGGKAGVYKFGAVDLPSTQFANNQFTVNLLRSDKRYYFVLIAEKDGQFVYMTEPVSTISN